VTGRCVGGIYANDSCPAEFVVDNLHIALSVIRAAHAATIFIRGRPDFSYWQG
jgi:hypothetical protein